MIICEKNKCTGCGVCTIVCPKQCISLKEGPLGHLFPSINKTNCINCGVCRKRCPSNIQISVKFPQNCYAAWAKDEYVYKTTTSGGIATVMSRYVISQGGVVYGCAMMPNIVVKHVRVDNYEDLEFLKGSKYVQSSIVDVLSQIKVDINHERLVLFIGTPCQVAAIKSIFNVLPTNLLLVDIICHGVPSISFLRNHAKRVVKTVDLDYIRFRERGYTMTMIKKGKTIYKMPLWEQRYRDLYLNTFIDGFSYRDSCNNCVYAKPERVGDITIGDFWGLGKLNPVDDLPIHKYGCSVVLTNTNKGSDFFDLLKKNIFEFKRPMEEALYGNDQLNHPKYADLRIRVFKKLQPLFGYRLYYILVLDRIAKYKIRRFLK